MITITSVLDFPSLSHYKKMYEVWDTPEYNVFSYLANSKGECYNVFAILVRLQLLRALAENGNKPFFAADLFGESESLGGWVNGLGMWNIIKPTGNTREIMIEVDDNLFRKCTVKEWTLNMNATYLRTMLDEFRAAMIDLI